MCGYRIFVAHEATRQLIQKITVAYLIVSFNICIFLHLLFSDCAPISTFYSWRPTCFPLQPNNLSTGFLTFFFCWLTPRWVCWSWCRSKFFNRRAWPGELWGEASTGRRSKKKNTLAPASVSALMQALVPCLSLHLPNLHFYGRFCSWWNVVRVVAFPSYLLPSAFSKPHAPFGIRYPRHFHAMAALACERLHLSSRLTARWFRILIPVPIADPVSVPISVYVRICSWTQTQNSLPILNPC